MQKHASSINLDRHTAFFSPLPTETDENLHYDLHAVIIPYSEEFSLLHYHNSYEIGFCTDGEGFFMTEFQISYISAGDAVFISPEVRHFSRSLNKEAPCRCTFMYLHRNKLETFLEHITGTAKDPTELEIPAVIRAAEYPAALQQLKEMIELCRNDLSYKEELLYLRLAGFLLEAERWFTAKPPTLVQYEPAKAAVQAAEYLSHCYQKQTTTAELSEMFHLSESQLRRQFQTAYGMPPMTYRNYIRCKIGAELLQRTALSVADISEKLGFNSSSDFYRMFRRYYSEAPSAFRKKERDKS